MTLTEFLLARIDEDEEAARAAAGWDRSGRNRSSGRWSRTGIASLEDDERRSIVYSDAGQVSATDADHMARHDPARVLAECAAKLRTVERCELMEHGGWSAGLDAEIILGALASVYADHPDYDHAWTPSPRGA